MRWKSTFPWYLAEMAIFSVLNVLLVSYVITTKVSLPAFNPFLFILLALATYRGAHIVANEKITVPLRAPFVSLTINEEGTEVETPKERGLRGAIGSLLYCPSCVGVWVATALMYGYLVFPVITLIIASILSLSALERFLTAIFDRLKT